MTYNTPELLLIGAAQNLVLQQSNFTPVGQKASTENCRGDEVASSDSYDNIVEW